MKQPNETLRRQDPIIEEYQQRIEHATKIESSDPALASLIREQAWKTLKEDTLRLLRCPSPSSENTSKEAPL
jgi:hypothetical protein